MTEQVSKMQWRRMRVSLVLIVIAVVFLCFTAKHQPIVTQWQFWVAFSTCIIANVFALIPDRKKQ